jgi:tetratricopeptide (TPR) repeat protein
MRLAACLLTAALFSGCAAHRSAAVADRLSALETFIEKTRQESMAARPPRANAAVSLEQRDPELAAARALVALEPSAAHHRRVAVAYARLGVNDSAYNEFKAALRLDPRDASAFDGLARVWRDWGFPHLGLSDAYHALFYAPDSAGAHNTLGTLLLDMRQTDAARAEFERALALDPTAGFALNNLCYAMLLQGRRQAAIDTCRDAVRANPSLTAAHNNLGLAYAAAGNLTAAAHEFSLAGDAAGTQYNLGVALMATRQFTAAASAFDEASALRPDLALPRQRAVQARALAAKAGAGIP